MEPIIGDWGTIHTKCNQMKSIVEKYGFTVKYVDDDSQYHVCVRCYRKLKGCRPFVHFDLFNKGNWDYNIEIKKEIPEMLIASDGEPDRMQTLVAFGKEINNAVKCIQELSKLAEV